MGFLSNLFNRTKSKDRAKQRLQIVLMHDRSAIAPEVMESIRQDILDVISRYMDVDNPNIDIDLKNDENVVALEVSVPVLRVRRPGSGS